MHEFGLGANYWHSQFVRVSANYLAYHTVGADAGKNLALVPSNLGGNPANISNWHHEFGMRVGLMF